MKQNIAAEFADLYYLREFDLLPERLGDYHDRMDEVQCRGLLKKGWLFKNRQEALRAREGMIAGYRIASTRVPIQENTSSSIQLSLSLTPRSRKDFLRSLLKLLPL